MDVADACTKCNQIIDWFVREHKEWIDENKLVSWAEKLGISLNRNNTLDESSLFHLFVLGVLWNSRPTYRAEKGEEVFSKIKDTYTVTKFREAYSNAETRQVLIRKARNEIENEAVFNILNFIVNGKVDNTPVWTEINDVLTLWNIGDKNCDVNRLRRLYCIFNPPSGARHYEGEAYLTKKVFLVFREIRIQFRRLGQFQYDPVICCVPDSHIEQAVTSALGIVDESQRNRVERIEWLLEISKGVAEYFCTPYYELYDLPLFFAHKERRLPKIADTQSEHTPSTPPKRGAPAGQCPKCGSGLVVRRAKRTGESYRGCTNFQGGCRWNNRSY